MAVIPFDDRDGFIWLDGKLVPWRDAKINVLTHGLHYASSVFEGERVYSGRIYKHAEHTKRLFESARILDMEIPFTEKEIFDACYEVAHAQGIENGYVRPIAFRGSEMMSVAGQNTKTRVAIAVWQWPSYFDPKEKLKGIRLGISKWKRPAPDTAPTNAKAAGLYMICTISKHEAEAQGYHDAIMYDYRGFIAEATGANVFFVQDGKLHTPTPDCFLDGITRRSVMALARARQIPVVERHIEPKELEGFTECFLTGTAAEVTPVAEIGPYKFKPAQITETLLNDYEQDVHRPVSVVQL
jgi:branched-chain amino acid aminotransferase